ncbi:MAG: hypothetical protein LBO72_04090 [Helicobacteraceae bacterium]|jgi:hypothetical protein|nr:hypothetical protein [Helicobacteraceae bacterium]
MRAILNSNSMGIVGLINSAINGFISGVILLLSMMIIMAVLGFICMTVEDLFREHPRAIRYAQKYIEDSYTNDNLDGCKTKKVEDEYFIACRAKDENATLDIFAIESLEHYGYKIYAVNKAATNRSLWYGAYGGIYIGSTPIAKILDSFNL